MTDAPQLILDIGNTSIKWATWNGAKLSRMQSARHHGALPMDLLAEWDQLPRISVVRACNVGPDSVADAVSKICATLWKTTPEWIQVTPTRLPIRIAYADPGQFGTDRWLALAAAHKLFPGPKLIMHAGTALVWDALTADGQHLGGLILPGIESLRTALLSNTQIPPHETADPDNKRWGATTGECIASACLQAPSALTDRLLNQLQAETGISPRLFITGGDAERLIPVLHQPATHHPDLVLQGITQLPMKGEQNRVVPQRQHNSFEPE